MKTTKDVLNIKCEVIDNLLTVKCTSKLAVATPNSWKIKIVHEQNILLETGFTSNECTKINLGQDGRYTIFVLAKVDGNILSHCRECVWYFTDEEQMKYRKYYESFNEQDYLHDSEELPLWELEYPYQNFALISFRDEFSEKVDYLIDNLQKINSRLSGFKMNDIGGIHNFVCATFVPIVISQDEKVFFSGKTRSEKRLIIGQNDIHDTDINAIHDEIGYFSMIHQCHDEIYVTNDYFGMYPLYVYKKMGICIVGNSYHLVLKIIKYIGEQLTLDAGEVVPYFITGQRMMWEQLVSHNTFIKEVRKLEIHTMCKVNDYGVNFCDKSIAEMLKSNIPFTDEKYHELLEMSVNEIVDNVRIVCEDERFEMIVCDVSGGKDSRTVLGALMNCGGACKGKIVINSQDLPYTNDKQVFVPLNNLHHFKYDDKGQVLKVTDLQVITTQLRSITIGTCFCRSIPWEYTAVKKENIVDKVKLFAGGEQILRPTYSDYFPYVDYNTPESISETVSVAWNNGETDYQLLKEGINTSLSRGLREVLCLDNYERFNEHCMYFRNVYHFGVEAMIDSIYNDCEIWSPLYSKNVGRTWHMVCGRFRNMRFQIDIIDKLCPALLKVPFELAEDRKKFEEIRETDKELDRRLDFIELMMDYNDEEWREAKERKRSNNVILDYKDCSEIIKKNEEFMNEYGDVMLYRLNKIIHYDQLFSEKLGIYLYSFLSQNCVGQGKNISRNVVMICNKITSVYDLINIVEESGREDTSKREILQTGKY